jgi:histone deacetylase complex regulatory component SIN3
MQTRFESEPHVYESFMDLLNTYKNQDKIIDEELYQMVCGLFCLCF